MSSTPTASSSTSRPLRTAELVRKIKAAQYIRNHPGEVCPAKWEEGEETLTPSFDLAGKI